MLHPQTEGQWKLFDFRACGKLEPNLWKSSGQRPSGKTVSDLWNSETTVALANAIKQSHSASRYGNKKSKKIGMDEKRTLISTEHSAVPL
ncbi:hypothetical protein FIBSPDRAFT_181706 [Athelia psychrophila]|uniref:Uncharacterized protein n=1 Tax=Athelia psychrophila TaxID=1759441 RepID=A0A166AKG1_9AGAM|nr:hypothetical protein FIBSPDRAFT_181706 [Fibularhizoctonia sp. CBS 109695]